MKRFIIDGRYGDLLKFYGISVEEALRKARLPSDVFSCKAPTMTEEEYFRFIDAIEFLVTDPEMLIKMSCTNSIESFSPRIFVSYCSKNGVACIEHLARYKRLVGPLIFQIEESESELCVELITEDKKNELPQFLVEAELTFLVSTIRRATKEQINPVNVTMINPINKVAFTEFLGVKVVAGGKNSITFLKEDMDKPFISYNEEMWNYFEPELSKKLVELDGDDSMSARVRSALMELLPGGVYGIEAVAAKLGLSKRTLQRRLVDEETTFQKQLNNIRELLAIHYIRDTDMTTNDIAYLLGYRELNSFLRAFTIWTGMSISKYKKKKNSVNWNLYR